MIDPLFFNRVVSGRHRDPLGMLLRSLLAGLEFPYFCGVSFRNFLYDKSWKNVRRLPVPVISVGNLTLGGTGKTPFVAWLIRTCREMKRNPGVASRGYRADETGWNDEARELAINFPGLPQAISPDRFTSSQKMIAEVGNQEKPIDLVILDDGFQHRQLHRDLDIVLLDASEPFGYGHVFPRGLLRESLFALKRADVVVLSHADRVSEDQIREIQKQVRRINPEICWCEIVHTPVTLLILSGKSLPIESLFNKNITAFCGIGAPEGFRQTLQKCGMNIEHFLTFPDHCPYDNHNLLQIKNLYKKKPDFPILCTMKDYVKLPKTELIDIPIHALMIAIQFRHGEEEFRQFINAISEKNE